MLACALVCVACADAGSRLVGSVEHRVLRGEDTGIVNAILTPPTILRYVVTRDSGGRIIPVGEGGGEAVHPSVACVDLAAFRCVMAMTPYPNGNNRLENPSILVGLDTTHWVEQRGTRNPVVPLPPAGVHNSDPDLNYDETAGRYFLSDRVASLDSNVVDMYASPNGSDWEARGRLLKGRGGAIVSQSFTMGHDGVPRMYYVSTRGCSNASADATTSYVNHLEVRMATDYTRGARLEDLHYGAPLPVEMSQPGFVPWHAEVRWVPALRQYVALMTDFAAGDTCLNDDLFLATSEDGVRFTTYPHALMWRTNPWHQFESVYRSSFVYDAEHDYLRIWLSVHTLSSQWTLWYMTVARGPMLQRLEDLRAAQ